MQVKFHGTRGSIPVPGSRTLRYGGNTSCVEVRSAAGTLVVLDCGTGSFGLGQALMAEAGARSAPLRGHVLITHTHWDHIQGIPFHAPFFMPGYEGDLYAPRGASSRGRVVKTASGGKIQESIIVGAEYHARLHTGMPVNRPIQIRIAAPWPGSEGLHSRVNARLQHRGRAETAEKPFPI